ncbi:MAG TPA: phage holin family protein [Solirubrobacterales bacterium]|nr:phage holin family protein [Solirubrobacterales bacterium]
MSLGTVRRAVLVLLLDALILLLLSEVLDGFVLAGPATALGAAAAIGLLNAFVWPLLARLALPLTVMTLGLAALVLNGILAMVAIDLLPRGEVATVLDGIVITLVVTAVTSVVYSLLAIDEDDAWYRNVVRRQARRRGQAIETDVPGVLFLEIDGLAHDILLRALQDGSAPHLSSWVRGGSHSLRWWETDWSSQTGACQAGLLHGSNEDMPAFRWWEKERGAAIVTNHPRDAEELERRHSDGRGLLHADGASRANILSGDAPHSMLTMSTALRRRRPIGKDYAAYFARPYAAARTLVLSLAEIGRERRAARSQVRDDVRPRIHRSRSYVFARAWGTVVQRDLQVATVIGDVLAGRPVIYTTFLAYDEVAHHSGIERHDALAVLRDLDRQIARIARACEDAPRPYRLVVLSDHGQSQGETFRDRYDQTLEELVRAACEPDSVVASEAGDEDALSYLSAGLTEVARDDTVAARTVRAVTRDRRADGVVALDSDARREVEQTHDGEDRELPELSVMASGCLGLISFPREPGRLSRERIEALYPRLIPTLREHPGIGFLLVRSEREGAMAIGPAGIHYLDDDRVEGEDPLAPFGKNAADHLRRTDGFPHCADLMLNSTYWPQFGEVAAFEELVGSHGGMGGTQSFPFVLHPAELEWPAEEVVGAERVHRIFRGWLAGLGQSAYASEVDSPGESTRVLT